MISKEILDLNTLPVDKKLVLGIPPNKRWQPYFIAYNRKKGNKDFLSFPSAKTWAAIRSKENPQYNQGEN